MQKHRSPVIAGNNVVSIAAVKVKTKANVGDLFFPVCPDVIASFTSQDQLIDLLAFLVLASGTGLDHSKTRWAAKSVGKRLCVRWSRAQEAIDRLVAGGKVHSLIPDGLKARPGAANYAVSLNADFSRRVWLPRALIEGTDEGETPPVERLMQAGRIGPAIALVRCYERLDMLGCGGVDIAALRQTAERTRRVQFNPGGWAVWEWTLAPPTQVADADFFRGQFGADDLDRLVAMSLLQWMPHLRTGGDEGCRLSPYADAGNRIERELVEKIDTSSRCGFPTAPSDGNWLWIALPPHIEDPSLIHVARPRYLPRTAPVLGWIAQLEELNSHDHPLRRGRRKAAA